jgi:hypothetical protein
LQAQQQAGSGVLIEVNLWRADMLCGILEVGMVIEIYHQVLMICWQTVVQQTLQEKVSWHLVLWSWER